MFRVSWLFIITMILILSVNSTSSMAGNSVNIRGGEHENYSRIVFDWPVNVGYIIKKQSDNNIIIEFDKSADFNFSKISSLKLPEIKSIEKITDKSVKIILSENNDYRNFKAGKRIVIDITAKNRNIKKPETSPEPVKEKIKNAKIDTKKIIDKSENKISTPKNENIIIDKIDVKKAKAPKKSETPKENVAKPIKIQISSTQTIGLSVFKRGKYLWIVTDSEAKTIRPRVKTNTIKKELEAKESIGDFKKIDINSGTAFKAEILKDYNIYVEGGGLIWNIILTPEKKERQPIEFVRNYNIDSKTKGNILWDSKNIRTILTLKDSDIGDELKIITVGKSEDYLGSPKYFLDFDTLDSYVGMAIRPKTDDIEVKIIKGQGVKISRTDGLSLMPKEDFILFSQRKDNGDDEFNSYLISQAEIPKEFDLIFNFRDWAMGGVSKMESNIEALLDGIEKRDAINQVETLMTVAKLYLANGYGAEAIGYFKYAALIMPELKESADFYALMGAARMINAQYDLAFKNLRNKALDEFEEINYWKAVTLSKLGDWAQAADIAPKIVEPIRNYPKQLRVKMALDLAEIALKDANVKLGEKYLAIVEADKSNIEERYYAAYNYLKGEVFRQKGEPDKSYEYWEPLTEIEDDYYRTRASLAYASLQLEEGEITPAAAIDRIEALRYAWRGDELEASINLRLGMVYMQYGDYLKGLSTLRNTAPFFPNTILGRKMTDIMTKTFYDIFLGDKVDAITPLDAVTVYEEFRELTPAGHEGDLLAQSLADRLIKADLLGRAAKLLQHQIDYRLEGKEAARIAIKLAAVYLMDGEYDRALETIEKASELYGNDASPEIVKEIALLKARALSKKGKYKEAINELYGLEQDIDVLKMRADISWQTGKWSDSSEALREIVREMGIKRGKTLTEQEAEIILNWAISLNLAGNRTSLNSLANTYGDAMAKTSKASQFDVVTRQRQNAILASRDTIASMVNEVDIFKDFLETYKKSK